MKKIKILTITLLIIAITMIAFIGVYTQNQNRMENKVKNYDLGMDLTGSRNIRLKVNTESKTKIIDAEGNEIEEETMTDEEIEEKGYQKEEIQVNPEEVKTLENYKKSQEIIEKRLEKLRVSNYIIKLDEQTGEIVIEISENNGTDQVVSNLSTVGKFEIVDTETKEVLLSNNDIKQARVMYGSGGTTTSSSGTTVYLDIEFNKEGAKKLEEISNIYVPTEEEENTNEETSEEEITVEEESTETTTEKTITMNVDDSEIMTTSFDEPVRTGRLQLSFGSASADRETLQGYIEQASSMATVLDTGNIPIKYDIEENQYILSDITQNKTEIVIYAICIITVLGMIAFIIRYKKLGILGIISYIGFISVLLIIVRYANVTIAIEGIIGILITFVLNYILVSKLIEKASERKTVYKDFFIKIIPIIIMVITFSFISWTPISSFGMTMFWGIVGMAIYNGIITNSLLKTETRKEK